MMHPQRGQPVNWSQSSVTQMVVAARAE